MLRYKLSCPVNQVRGGGYQSSSGRREPHRTARHRAVVEAKGLYTIPSILLPPPSSSPHPSTCTTTTRAFLYHKFLTPEECDHIISLARPRLERSEVVAREGEGSNVDDVRTSFGTFLDYQQDDVIKRIEQRIAAWTFLPVENQEAMQVLRYQEGQKYEAHHDFFEKEGQQGGHRYATVLMYLTEGLMGGETVFPDAKQGQGQQGGHRYATVLMYLTEGLMGGETVFLDAKDPVEKDDTWSECGKQGVAAKPIRGDALLFFSLTPSAELDLKSLHAGCPVISGEKWSATKWIHVGAFYTPSGAPAVAPPSDGSCEDKAQHCVYWKTQGECDKNQEYMHANCPKSCGVCSA
ncbi:unnamed protein product [Closterium sp. NIES-65]|nr:unnamed protein product [Closterium sp. NIES-65]